MTRTFLGTLAGLGLVAALATRLEPGLRGGVLAGYVGGAAVGVWSVAFLRRVMRTAPQQFMAAITVGFMIKLAGVAVGALALRYVEGWGALADWRGFVLAYAAAVFVCLGCGSVDVLRETQGRPEGEPVL